MATKQQLAQKYVTRLRNVTDESHDVQEAEIEAIANDIKSLTWEETNKTLTTAERLDIVRTMESQLDLSMPRRDEGLVGIMKEADNKRYLALVRTLRGLLSERRPRLRAG